MQLDISQQGKNVDSVYMGTGELHNEEAHDLSSSPKYYTDQLKENQMGRIRSTQGRIMECVQNLVV
jgi:hypothetical protein